MKAADSSCLTWMKRILSLRTRNASMMPFMPSPGIPKITSTPHLEMVSTRISPAVFAIARLDPLQRVAATSSRLAEIIEETVARHFGAALQGSLVLQGSVTQLHDRRRHVGIFHVADLGLQLDRHAIRGVEGSVHLHLCRTVEGVLDVEILAGGIDQGNCGI